MSRSVPEWVGRNDDDPVPDRVRVRVFTAKDGRCHKCKRRIFPGERWTCEHVEALINGGKNRESNLDITCSWCVGEKNAEDVAIKSKNYKVRKKHIGARRSKNPIPGSRGSGFRKRMDGTVERVVEK